MVERKNLGAGGDSGLYVLVLKLKNNRRIKPGQLPETEFKRGTYLYVGRAKRGLRKRLERHLKKRKRLFWHIDYFLRAARITGIWVKLRSFDECRTIRQIRNILKRSEVPQKRFGASDCHCLSHLLYLPGVKAPEDLRKRLAFKKAEIRIQKFFQKEKKGGPQGCGLRGAPCRPEFPECLRLQSVFPRPEE